MSRIMKRLGKSLLAATLCGGLLFGLGGGVPPAAHAEEPGAGDLLHESYDLVAEGAKPAGAGWSFRENQGIIGVAGVPSAEDRSLRIERTGTDAGNHLYARQVLDDALTGRYVVRTRVMAEQTNATVIALQLRSSDNKEVAVFTLTSDGTIRYQLATSTVVVQPYSAGVWYELAAVIDTETQQYRLLIDGEDRTGPLDFKNMDAADVKQIDHQVFRTTLGVAYFDDLDIYTHSVSLNDTAVTLPLGQSESLQASVLPSFDTLKAITWSTSDPNVVRVDEHGTMTAWGAGTATVTAVSSGGAAAECVVTVPEGPAVALAGLSVSPKLLTMSAGDSAEVQAQLEPFYATNKKVSWSSSEPSVVAVAYDEEAGSAVLSALRTGTATITAVSDDGGYSDSMAVTVTTPGDLFSERFEAYAVGARPATLSVPTAAGVTAAVDDTPYPATQGRSFRIDKLDDTGSTYLVSRAVEAGHSKMKVSLRAMARQTDAVVYTAVARNIAGQPVLYVAFHSSGKIAVMNGGSWEEVEPYETNRWYQFDLALNADTDTYDLYIDGVPKRLALPLLQPLDEIRRVQFGIYGQSAGTAYFDDFEYYSYRPVTGFGLTGLPGILPLNRTIALKPDFMPAEPTFTAVQWSSSDPGVLAVDAFGNATGVSEGTATLTGTTADGGLTASVPIQVRDIRVEGVALDTTAFTLPLGSDRLLQARLQPADASRPDVTWSSSDPSVAEVNAEGRVYAVGEGTALITVASLDGGYAASGTVTVTARSVQAEFYVSPDGDDDHPGTESMPFRTIERARDAVRAINDDMTGDIVVYLRDGRHRQQSTLRFDERDSGSNGYWVVYKAYTGEKPVIEGGRTISGWTLHDAENNIYKAYAGGDIETRQLYVNGIRAVRARSEAGLTNPVKTATGYISDDAELASWSHIGDLEFVYKAEWTNPRNRVQSIEIENGKAVIAMQQPGWRYVTVRPSVVDPWYLENAYELLDQPGEWYLDRTTDTFYYKPRPGEEMGTAEVIAPVVEELVKISGTTLDTPADGIRFEGLTFSYTTWLRPSSDLGHADAQNNLLRYGIDKLPIGAVTVEKAMHIGFERNEFSKLGVMAIKMVNGVQESLIRGNRFFDLSGGAINVGEVTKHDTDISQPSDPRKLMKNVDIVNNYIHDIGVDYRSSAAIGLGFVADADVSHNHIFNVPYTGITTGFGFGYVTTSALRNAKLHANFIHDLLGEQIYDGGAIYTLGGTGGTADNKNEITENYLRNQQNRYGVIYTDEGSTYWRAARNVIDQRETPVWDEIFPATWAFVNGALTSHDIVFDSNYTTTPNRKLTGTNVTEVNTYVVPDGAWPAEALAIIANAGLEPAYEDLAQGVPERIILPEKMTLTSGGSAALHVAATTGKDAPVDLSDAMVYYSSGNEAVAQVSATGVVYATGAGATRIGVHIRKGEMQWNRTVPVYVDDPFDRIEVYYVENKAKQFLGDAYSMPRGLQLQLHVEAKSLYGQTLDADVMHGSSSQPSVVEIDDGGVLKASGAGSADIQFSLTVGGVTYSRVIRVTVESFGDPAGLAYEAYPMDELINDPDHWAVYASGSGHLQWEPDRLSIVTPSGFASYLGRTFENELFTMDLVLDAQGGWPSLALRSQQPNEPFTSATNDLYLISFKEDVIELQRFNGGVRTVIYGNLVGFPSIGGPAVPNHFIPFGEKRRVQAGAINENGGVRLILNIDGENVMYFLDTAADRIEDPGYFGLYARTGNMIMTSVGSGSGVPAPLATLSPEEPGGRNGWYTEEVVLTLEAEEEGPSQGFVAMELRIGENGAWQPYTGPVTFGQDGSYEVGYRTHREGETVGEARTVRFSIDRTAPTVTLAVYDAYEANAAMVPADWIVDVADAASGVDESSMTVMLDDAVVEPRQAVPLYRLPPGTHTLTVMVKDAAGNLATATAEFTVEASITTLQALVAEFHSLGWIGNDGMANSLMAKLNAGSIQSFVHQVTAQSGKHITEEAAAILIGYAQA